MNNPPYIVVDEMAIVVAAVKAALALPELNYQYGYITELKQTLKQYSETNEFKVKKFPLIWVRQPFRIVRTPQRPHVYGDIENLAVFIINETDVNWKAEERMANNFKPVIYPIYRELINQINLHPAFHFDGYILPLEEIDRYWWGEETDDAVLDDIVDCMQLENLGLSLNNNENCSTFKSF